MQPGIKRNPDRPDGGKPVFAEKPQKRAERSTAIVQLTDVRLRQP